jgi:hypothetical protein
MSENSCKERAIEKWLNLSANSELTVQVYLHRMGLFCKMVKVDLNNLIKTWKEVRFDLKARELFLEELRDKIDEFHAILKKQGFSPNYITNCIAAICRVD